MPAMKKHVEIAEATKSTPLKNCVKTEGLSSGSPSVKTRVTSLRSVQ